MIATWLALGFALLGALTIAVGTVIRQRIAEELPPNAGGRFGPAAAVLRRPLWWAGTAVSLSGFGWQAFALHFGSLLLVAPVLVLSLMFSLPLNAHYSGRRISPVEWAWASALTIAVGVLVAVGKPQAGHGTPATISWILAIGVATVLIGWLVRFARRQSRRDKAMLLGVATGAIFGYIAVLTKAVVDVFAAHGALGTITSWELYGLIAAAILGTAVQQASFHAGALQQSFPAMVVAEPVVAAILGIVVLREFFAVDGAGWAVIIIAAAVAAVSTVMLARSEAVS